MKYDVVLLDVAGNRFDNDDETICPPPIFLSDETLENLQQILLPNGTFILDLIYNINKYNGNLNKRVLF